MNKNDTKNEVWTVKRVLHWLTQKFKHEGFKNPRLESEIAVAKAIKGDRVKVYIELEKPLTESERSILRQITRRRLAREPYAYILGHKEFFSLDFKVNKNVLIPRPETELMIEEALKHIKPGQKILDVGTGSGAIAVSLAVNTTDVSVFASDISEEALKIATENAKRYKVEIKFFKGSLFEPFQGKKFDLIMANLPYIPTDYVLPEDVAYEPESALFSGEDGLDLIRKFLFELPNFIENNGIVFMEFGDNQKQKINEILIKYGYNFEFYRDLANAYRFVKILF